MNQTNLITLDYKDWYINQKRVPDRFSDEYDSFFNYHKEICLRGCIMNGEFINPFLYWHLNVWHTEVDILDEYGRINQKYANPLLRDNEWVITNEIERAHEERKGLIILGVRRLAKALRNDELLYTESGNKQIGDAKIGDRIFDHTGNLTTITGVFPQGKIQTYKLTLEDNRTIYCCENHIWKVKNRKGKIQNLSIKELLPVYRKPRTHNGYKDGITRNINECFFKIPNNNVIQYSKKDQTIDPYFLGLWLGDGNSRNLGITNIDKEVIDYIYKYAENLNLKIRQDDDSYFITSGIRGGTLKNNILTNYFNELGLLKNKHIPLHYLEGDEEQRIALLQGLMDTDGSVYSNGTISFTTTNKRLAKDFYSLCRSLGINLTKKQFIPKLYGREIGVGWLFTLFTEKPIFRLKRKLDNIKIGNKGKQTKINWTTIRKIELDENAYSTCITVDNEDKLFLTTDFTITHNSVIEASYTGWGATFDENSQNVIAGLNAPDIKLITDKLDKGLNFLPEAWRWQRVEDNWTKQVTLGIKTKAGERIPFSQILIRNLDGGANEEAIAGTKPRKLIIDEIGKGSFLRAFQAATPGFTTPYGWGCSPILVGCVCAGTKVWTKEGELINIEQLNKEQGLIGYNGDDIQTQEINWFKPPEYKDCYRIYTDNGGTLECSNDHPLLITKRMDCTQKKGIQLKNAYYQETKDLQIKDQILLPASVEIFGNEEITYARVLGLLIGDGTYSDDPTISISEKEIFDYLKPITRRKGKTYNITKDRIFADVYLTDFRNILRKHGMYKETKFNKRLPDDLVTFDKKSCAELLGGYFDADGNVYYNKKKNIVRIVLTGVVFELLEEVRYLLLKFGIVAMILKENRNSIPQEEYKGQQKFIYRLYINQQQDIVTFRNEIKFLVKEKQDKLFLTKYSKYKKFDCRFKINPLNNKEGFFNSEILSNLRCVTITKIEHIGEKLVYNLNCGPNHNYLSNGFITRQTGGDMQSFMDAKGLMFDAANFNFLDYPDAKDPQKRHGLFLSNKYRMEGKEQSTLGSYLQKEKGHPLYDVPMLVSNEEKSEKFLADKLENLKKAGDRIAYLKEKMYYPREVNDIFLNEDTNIFDIEAAKRQKAKLLQQERTGTPVILFDDGNGVKHEFTDKMPLSNFPLKNSDNKDAPVVIYEFPMENPPYGLYVAGIDPYRQGKAAYSTSLGSVYIYKRMHAISSEKYQDMFVASYCARPDKKEVWEDQARYLIKFYNARALCENDEISFIDYMIAKGDDRYLERQPEWLKEIVPNTTVRRDYGIHRSADKIRDFLHSCLKKYTEEAIHIEKNEEGEIISEIKGMSKILDPVLLEEMIQFSEDGNFDRIVAAELAIALAMKLNPILGKGKGIEDPRMASLIAKKKKPGLFNTRINMFSAPKNKLFT